MCLYDSIDLPIKVHLRDSNKKLLLDNPVDAIHLRSAPSLPRFRIVQVFGSSIR
ncbi:hypothetical protein SAMD00023353_0502690 [Rosellinia necatrix]|uniref:Uncharacterized protein n=1 Tax=Rosellinia necatrix TaxID=77044 RepID=A0A1S8A5L1_ROSNE|nr:hypothetical protein SAMD00023353_0502690 [Rosellinia necatrix]